MKKIILPLLLISELASAKIIQEQFIITDISKLKQINKTSDIIIDHVKSTGFEIYGPKGLSIWLTRNNIPFKQMEKISTMNVANYPTPEQVESQLKSINSKYPKITSLFSIGKSVKGRNQWVMKINSILKAKSNKPKFKYIANMHGDEIVGRELMIRLINDLTTNYNVDPFITNLIDQIDIYILPSMNPDGAAAGTRYNAQGVDLNRDFPDFTTSDDKNILDGRAVETQNVMKWQAQNNFKLSANFHGGAEVVNYPWDTQAEDFPELNFARNISLNYAKAAPYIFNSNEFANGITNGYEWYEVNGGMQDWSYHWHHDLQITIELSNQKWPSYSSVDYYYQQNRTALLNFIKETLNR